jgi:hypothetical protein
MNTQPHIRAAEILEAEAESIWRAWSLDDEWIGPREGKLLMQEQRAVAATLRASSLLEWHYIDPSDRSTLPDDEIRVWVAVSTNHHVEDAEIYEAYHEADHWLNADNGFELKNVYAWAHIPEAPPRKP